jgi:hypothetical protein
MRACGACALLTEPECHAGMYLDHKLIRGHDAPCTWPLKAASTPYWKNNGSYTWRKHSFSYGNKSATTSGCSVQLHSPPDRAM